MVQHFDAEAMKKAEDEMKRTRTDDEREEEHTGIEGIMSMQLQGITNEFKYMKGTIGVLETIGDRKIVEAMLWMQN